jgi:hypothetical protein
VRLLLPSWYACICPWFLGVLPVLWQHVRLLRHSDAVSLLL